MSRLDEFETLKLTILEALRLHSAKIKTLVIQDNEIKEFEVESVPPSYAGKPVRQYIATRAERELLERVWEWLNNNDPYLDLIEMAEAFNVERSCLLEPECDWDDGETSANAAEANPEAGIRAVGFRIYRTNHGYETARFTPGTGVAELLPAWNFSSTLEAARAAIPPGLFREGRTDADPASLVESYI